jgi:type II secretion system protein N
MTVSVPSWMRVAGYPGWFSVCFFFFLYATFPLDMVKGPVVAGFEDALGKGKQGRYGVDPEVKIDKLDVWRMTGVKLKRVSMRLGSTDPDPGPVIDLDAMGARVGFMSLLLNDPTVHFSAELYGGELSGSVSLKGDKQAEDAFFGHTRALLKGKAQEVSALYLKIDGVDLSRAPPVLEKVGVPITGVLGGKVDLDLGEDPAKEGKGVIDLKLAGVTLGPGELKIPLPGLTGGLTLPLIHMGDLEVKAPIEEGKAKFEKLGTDGKDFKLGLDLDLNLGSAMKLSRLTGDGSFQISEQFLEENSKFKTILDFAAPMKRARDDQGRYHFNLRGTLGSPKFTLSSSGGKSTSRRRR